MEKNIRNQRIIIVLLTVMLIFSFFSLQETRSSFENLESNIGYRFENIGQNINSIYNEIADMNDVAAAETSLITSFEYEYGELDTDKMTVPVRVEIIPKAITDASSVFLEFGSRSVEMKKSESSMLFTAEFELGVFDKDTGFVMLVIKTDNKSETQQLEWRIEDLRSEAIPYASAAYIFEDITCSEKSGIIVDGTISVVVEDEKEDQIKNTRLIYKMNGEVVAEEEIFNDDHIQIYKVFNDYGIGDTFEFYFIAEDSFGFVHETLLKSVTFTEYGEVEDEGSNELNETIKDKEGNILYPG